MGLLFSSKKTKKEEGKKYFKTSSSRLNREQVKQITWKAKSLSQKQRAMVRNELLGVSGGVTKQRFKLIIQRLYKEGEISAFDKKELLKNI